MNNSIATTDLHSWGIIAAAALVTAGIRFLPFLVFGGGRKTPVIIERFGKVLPFAVMGMLVVYCLKDVSFTAAAGFLPQMISVLLTAALYIWKRNTLVSIVSGTLCCMVLTQMVF